MNKTITIVTAFFDIGRSDWTVDKGYQSYHRRTTDTYFEYFSNLAQLENQMIIFTSKHLRKKVLEIRKNKPTIIIEVDLNKKFKHSIKKIRMIQNKDSFKSNLPDYQKGQPEYTSPEYVLINNLKSYFIKWAIRLNIINNEMIAWLDFGYFRSHQIMAGIKEWKYSFDNKINCFTINNTLYKLDREKATECLLKGEVFIIGGVLVGDKRSWSEFNRECFYLHKKAIREQFIDDDQYFNTMCYYDRPELIKLNYLGKNKWFDLFKKYGKPNFLSYCWKIRLLFK